MSVRIVLVEPSHPGNIGSAARAMKTMGFDNLYLVNPKSFPHQEADAMASGATDVLDRAVVAATLSEALKDCHLVFGCSARNRHLDWPMATPRQAVDRINQQEACAIAILFGRERTGLTNQELQLCHYHIHIPSNPDYASLNLAAAVQVICYELRASLTNNYSQSRASLAPRQELDRFYAHLEKTLIELQFLNPQKPKRLMERLMRLFQRAQLDQQEVNILRGVLASVDKKGSVDG